MKKMSLLLRRATETDLPEIREIINHYVRNTPTTFEMREVSIEDRLAWFRNFTENGRHQLVLGEREGKVAGYACSLRYHERPAYDTSVMTSVYLHPKEVGKGYGKQLYRRLLDDLESSGQVHRAYGLVVLPNSGSESLHEALGFQEVGVLHEAGYKLGAYHSVRIYEKRFA